LESPTLPSPSLLRKTDFHPFSRVLVFVMYTADRVIATLRAHEAELRQAGLRSLSLFGSVARGETETDSDIDLAAEFDPATRMDLLQLVALERRITALLGSPVDLLPEPVEKRRLQDQINRDRRRAF
jgi:predicted nucleotidyltransferase